ncbi:glycosyltransferase family 4 protein [Cellulomonas sp. zg-ZUI199]|uniref:Glycosyltransferase family 4 protein n=1 Tax=Cellulomonas wangleii TaxID=2816956 RepID=A0ABX8D163_9CELL|nr:glycosyltransferase family 4 protein [Cellulomonas wangleii]MBO0925287.1 glycosyltransferase family 4 protein [Cellulomonas wangleii]QVI61213.1 glycosyltransferase family 4 protein [Cellulomonas wangleii]
MAVDVPVRRVLVVTLDTIADQMAGPAIRAWEIARHVAAQGHHVRLVTFGSCSRVSPEFEVARVRVEDFRAEVEAADVVVLQGYVAATFPWLQQADVVLVVDLYDPFHIEGLEVERHRPLAARDAAMANALRELSAQVSRGDVFLCASSRQRDLWIGHLAAAGRVNPLTYDADPTLANLVRVVPFGISPEPPVATRHAIKGTVPGIAEDDLVVLWGGGVYNWFDPLTLVHAIDRLRHVVPNVRLYFLGMRHPNPDVPEMRMASELRALARRLDLVGTHVFFNEEWVAYEERADYLLDADVGVSCHFPGIETEFSFRTRLLDYLWAGLPVVATEGDAFAPLIDAEGLGRTVPARDPQALADALGALLGDEETRRTAHQNVVRVRERFEWPVVLPPVVDVCSHPARAADAERMGHEAAPPAARRVWGPGDLGSLVRHLRHAGVRHTYRKVLNRLRRPVA